MSKPFGGAKVIYIAQKIEKESKQSEEPYGDEIPHPYDGTNGDLIQFYSDLIEYNAFHGLCINKKVACSVRLGMNIVDGPDDFDPDMIVNDKDETIADVVSKVCMDFESTGNGYMECVRGKGGKIQELYHCPSPLVTHRPRGAETRFYYQGYGGRIPFPSYSQGGDSSLLYFQNYTNSDRFYGLPDWRSCIPDIELDYYAVRYNQKFFVNSGIPDLAIVVEGGEFDQETEEKVVSYFQSNFKGWENAHKVLYLPVNSDGVKVRFEKLAVDAKDRDASFDTLRSRCRDNIVSAHDVPPRLVGVVTTGQLGAGGEVQGQFKVFQETHIAPKQRYFEGKLTPLLKDMGIISSGRLRFEAMDVNIQEKDSEYYPKMVESGIITVDEAREALGYGPMEEHPEAETAELSAAKTIQLVKSIDGLRRRL